MIDDCFVIESSTVTVDLVRWEMRRESTFQSCGMVWRYDGMVLCQIFLTKSPCLVLSLDIQKCIREKMTFEKCLVILGRPQHQHTNQVMFNISQARTDLWPLIPQPRSRHHLTALSKPDQKKTGSSSRGFHSSSDRNLGLFCGCVGPIRVFDIKF